MTTSWWVLAGSTFSVESAYIMWFNLRSALNNNKVWFPAWVGSKNHAQSSSPGFLPILRTHSRNLITILKILSFLTKMHSPDCRNFTGLAYSASTQCKPPSARQQNVIRMAFSWRADVQGGGGGGGYSDIFTHT